MIDSELDECRYCTERNNLTPVRIINSNSIGALCPYCLKTACVEIEILEKKKETIRESLMF